ncbi:MAG: DUF401 family protein [Sulfolobales archaeon]|nr:DUF401 family protein [Sulfolobales archaeon]MDW8010921.1 DUF401 family protein [Sulfolobales archaeon]
MSAVAALLAVIAAIIACLKIGLSLGLSITLVAVGLGLYTGSIYRAFLESIVSEDMWILTLSALSIALLAELYRITGAVKDLGHGLSASLKDPRAGLAVVPAVVGLMPVAGGALLSAPLVESLGAPLGLPRETLAYINVWFRHTLIYSYPFSQLVVVLSQLTGVSVFTIVVTTLPVSALMTLLGIPALLRIKPRISDTSRTLSREHLESLIPILVAVVLLVPLTQLLGNWAIPVGTLVATLLLVRFRRALKLLPRTVLSKRVGDIVLAVAAVVMLREVISLSGISAELQNTVQNFGNMKIALAALSALVSIATGSVMTGLFISLPILSSAGLESIGSVLLVYTYSFIGYIASPTHLCLLYTVEYFKANLINTYKHLLPPVLVVLLVGTLYYLAI